MADTGWKGGVKPTGLGSGQDGFSGIPDRKATFKSGAGETLQTGREESVNVVGTKDNGGGG